MKKDSEKSKPIPTRYDKDVSEMIRRIHSTTGLSQAEIVRRAVRYALSKATEEKSLEFLLGSESEIEAIFQEGGVEPLEQDDV